MITLRRAAEQALAAIKSANQVNYSWACVEAVAVLEAALAEEALQRLTDVSQEIEAALTEPKQEPFAYYFETYSYEGQKDRWFVACPCDGKLNGKPGMPLYTAPPQRKPLTDEEIEQAYRSIWRNIPADFDHTSIGWIEQGIRYAEQAHGIKGKA